MKHYLNKFENQTGYTNAVMGVGFKLPHVSLVESTNEVKYAPIFNPKYLYSDLSTSRVLDSSKTVIGIEVIPASHETDGKARYMSVKNMSKSTPEDGTISNSTDANIPSGSRNDYSRLDIQGLNVDIYQNCGYDLARDQEAITEDNPFGIINELSSHNQLSFTTDLDSLIADNNYPFFDGAYIYKYVSVSSATAVDETLPYPFNADGTKNHLYWNNGNGMAITDMDGFNKTAALINRIAVEGWQTGELNTNVSTVDHASAILNHPAAAACYRFNPVSSNTTHLWYLPSIGELGYLAANIVKINAKIDALPSGQGVKLDLSLDKFYIPTSNGSSIADDFIYLDYTKNSCALSAASGNAYSDNYRYVRAFIAI